MNKDDLRTAVQRGYDFAAAIESYAARYGDPGFDASREYPLVSLKATDFWIATVGRRTIFDPQAEFQGDADLLSCPAEDYHQIGPLSTARKCLRHLLWRIGTDNDGANPDLPITTGLDHVPHEGLGELPALIRALDELKRQAGPELAAEQATATASHVKPRRDDESRRTNIKQCESDKKLIKAMKKALDGMEYGLSKAAIGKRAGVARESARLRFKDEKSNVKNEWDNYRRQSNRFRNGVR